MAVFFKAYLFLLVCLLACGSEPPPDVTDPGQLLFLGYANEDVNCARCHGQDGEGTNEGEDIRQVFDELGEVAIRKIILAGKGLGPDAMPAFAQELTDDDLLHLLTFLKTLQSGDSRFGDVQVVE